MRFFIQTSQQSLIELLRGLRVQLGLGRVETKLVDLDLEIFSFNIAPIILSVIGG